MPSAAVRPYLIPTSTPNGTEPSGNAATFDPLLILRAAVTADLQAAVSANSNAAPGVRRRGSPQQGRALETLGHAVEYLIDSRMFQLGDTSRENETEAVQVLMRLSRLVFNECPEVVSLQTRLRRLFERR